MGEDTCNPYIQKRGLKFIKKIYKKSLTSQQDKNTENPIEKKIGKKKKKVEHIFYKKDRWTFNQRRYIDGKC